MRQIKAIKVNKAGQPVRTDPKAYSIAHPNDHVFDSILEQRCWKIAENEGIKCIPHALQAFLFDEDAGGGWSYSVRKGKLTPCNLGPIRYTPDLILFKENGAKIYIEVKDRRCESYSEAFKMRFNIFCRQLAEDELAIIAFGSAEFRGILKDLDKKFKLQRKE